MELQTWVLYVLTVLALMSTPGASQLLMLSNSATHGFRKSLATATGDLSANSLQMLAAALGLGVIVTSSETALQIIKWLGVAYLIWHGLRTIKTAKPLSMQKDKGKQFDKTLFFQGFITSASNPKAVIFFAALFPQFIVYDDSFWLQFFVLSVTYLTIDGLFLCAYGWSAERIISLLKPKASIWVNRVGGLFLLLAALLLGLKSVDDYKV
jgi:homoserine/homoserine lactone efflux protein